MIDRPVTLNRVIKPAPPQVTSLPFDNEEPVLICQMDKQWSYVGNKKNQR